MSQVETDCFRLGRHAMFRTLRENLPALDGGLGGGGGAIAQNLLECKDDMLFAWNEADSCVLSLNWRAAYSKDADCVAYQTLIPTTPQVFTVDKITVSTEGSFLALSGSRGVAIMELPRRWGPNGQYQAGKKSICCSTYNLDERFFISNSSLEVRQVRWHPASPKDSHLMVLLSNNTIRLYEEFALRMVWRIGPVPSASPVSGATTPYLSALGDTAVDFDIAPPRAVPSSGAGDDSTVGGNSNIKDNANSSSSTFNDRSGRTAAAVARATRVEWPLIVLRGNGNLYVVLIGLDTDKPQLQGPLRITPATADNYGLDYCAVLVLPSQPPTLVLAESNGNLHHGILLDADASDESCASEVDASLRMQPAEWCLHVLDTVQLELGLAGANTGANRSAPNCSIFLRKDSVNDARYFAHHETGLHAVTVEFVAQLARFAGAADPNPDTSNVLGGRATHAEYLVCTQALDSRRANAVLGFALLQSPDGLVLWLASGQLVSLNRIADTSTLRDLAGSGAAAGANGSRAAALAAQQKQQSFELHISTLLSSQVTQPLLQLSGGGGGAGEPTAKETLELLLHATHVLREQYFVKHDLVKRELEKRVKLLQLMRSQQRTDIGLLQRDKDTVRSAAERLAERYEDIQEKQVALFRRAQEVVRLVAAANPQSAAAEAEFGQQIERIAVKSRRLAGSIAAARRRVGAQETQTAERTEGSARKGGKVMVLQPRMEETIRTLMSELNTDIETQIKEVKNIRANANIA